MATESEHANVIFSGILPHRKDLLEKALLRLGVEHFPESIHKNLFKLLRRYYEVNGAVLTESALGDLTRKMDFGKRELFNESYKAFENTKVTDADFLWSVDQLRERVIEKSTLEVMNKAVEVLTKGIVDETTGENLQGAEAAKNFLVEGLGSIDRTLLLSESPEGDMREEEADILKEYEENKASRLDGTSRGIEFGIANLDEKLGGMQNGELILAAGYSSDGKSSLSVQAAWSASVEQGKNVVFLTTETLRPQIRRKILARHSKLPIFNMPEGLNTRDLKRGTLTERQEEMLKVVAKDLSNNPDYGKLYIAQVPRGSSISEIEQTLYRLQREFHIDFVVMDYLALLVSDRRRQTTREELASILREAKQVATTFDGGRGIPLLSPWQVSRLARENAEKIGAYSSASLSETAEATNSADIIVSILAPTDNTSRYAETTMQVLKARDAETANDLLVEVDYATSCFTAKQGIASFGPAATLPTDGDQGLDSFLN